jgi:hypothetical protein
MESLAIAAVCVVAWVASGYAWRLAERYSSVRRRGNDTERPDPATRRSLTVHWMIPLTVGLGLTVLGLLTGDSIADRGSPLMFGLLLLALALVAFQRQRGKR